jgi:hypothetical protein
MTSKMTRKYPRADSRKFAVCAMYCLPEDNLKQSAWRGCIHTTSPIIPYSVKYYRDTIEICMAVSRCSFPLCYTLRFFNFSFTSSSIFCASAITRQHTAYDNDSNSVRTRFHLALWRQGNSILERFLCTLQRLPLSLHAEFRGNALVVLPSNNHCLGQAYPALWPPLV